MAIGAVCVIPLVYALLTLGAAALQYVLTVLFIGLAAMLLREGIRSGAIARDRTITMLITFAFNILFWMFCEQAGNSFTFLADQIVNRVFGGSVFPTAWFQSVPALAVIVLAPVVAWFWVWMAKRNLNPSIPRKFGLCPSDEGKIPFWTPLTACVIQVVGERCLSPIACRWLPSVPRSAWSAPAPSCS